MWQIRAMSLQRRPPKRPPKDYLAEIRQWEAEAAKADVVSFFAPQDDRVTVPPEPVPLAPSSQRAPRW